MESTRKHSRFRRFLWVLLIIAGIGVLSAGGLTLYAILTAPNGGHLDPSLLTDMQQSSFVYDKDDKEVTSVYGKVNRINIPLSDVPKQIQMAFIAAEDLRFYKHFGIDVIRIGGALLRDIKTLSLSQGASTITQQLIKNNYLTQEKSWIRKIREAWMAIQLEMDFSKDEILEMYLNHSYFGNGANGIEAAAETYFGKTAKELTVAEGALLAGVLKSPTKYAPHTEPENSVTRRNLVLSIMRDNGFITPTEYDAAVKEPLKLAPQKDKEMPAGWYVEAVMKEAEGLIDLSGEELLTAGLRIYTGLDPALQKTAEALAADAELFPAPAEDGTQAETALALVAADGQVRVLVGGRQRTVKKGFNRAVDMKRQPGSTLKPLAVYAPAVDRFGYSPVTMMEDVQTDFGGYMPANFGEKYYGWVTLRTALMKSLNVPAVKTLDSIGLTNARAFLENVGIPLDARDNSLSLALGAMTYGVSPLDLAMAYQVFLGQGQMPQRTLIRRIESWEGKVLYEAKAQKKQVMTPASAYVMTSLLETAATEGTAKRLADAGVPVAGKTGSINYKNLGNRDAWIAAMTPDYTLAVWMGFDQTDDAHMLPNDINGGTLPTRLAARLLKAAYAGKEAPAGFPEPAEGITRANVELYALENDHVPMLAGELAPPSAVIEEVFVAGTEPRIVSDYWQRPQAPGDFLVQAGPSGLPRLSFTARGANVVYRIYRQEGGQPPTLVSTGEGPAGTELYLDDTTAARMHTYSYFVVPVHKLAMEMGVENPEGTPSATLSYRVPLGIESLWDDWMNTPEPAQDPNGPQGPQETAYPDAGWPGMDPGTGGDAGGGTDGMGGGGGTGGTGGGTGGTGGGILDDGTGLDGGGTLEVPSQRQSAPLGGEDWENEMPPAAGF